jgi:DNA-binding transcriptional LysR family regulator
VKLLLRTTRTVKVTDEGLKVFQWAQKILGDVSDMKEDLAVG